MRQYIINNTLVNNNYNYLLINMDNRISDNSNKIKLIETHCMKWIKRKSNYTILWRQI